MTEVQPGSFLTLHYRLAGPDGADVVNTFGALPFTLSLGTGELARQLHEQVARVREAGQRIGQRVGLRLFEEHRVLDDGAGLLRVVLLA